MARRLSRDGRGGPQPEARTEAGGLAARASPDAAPGPDASSELARAKARIAELERKIGKQQMDLDFFREALRLIDALEAKALATKTNATSSTRSSKR